MTPLRLFASTLGTAPEGFHTVTSVNTDTLMYTVYRNEGTLLVAFGPTKGNLYWTPNETFQHFTEEGRDWFRNFDMAKVNGVHRGFRREWQEIKPAILKEIKTYQPSLLILTGFSQGSAHATIALPDLYGLVPDAEAHAFATPRVYGWMAGAEYDNWLAVHPRFTLTRYNHRADPVQHTPLGIQGFAHVGYSVRFGKFTNPFDVAGNFSVYHDPKAYMDGLQ